jgi:O-antigen ligase
LESQEEGLDVSDARSSSLAYRFSGYSSGFEKFLESPIIGIGYSMPFREYIRSMDQESPMTELDVELSRTYIENSYINVLVYQGVVGISILFYLIYVFFSRLKYCSRIADKEVRSIYKALIFGFISIAAGSALSGLEYSSAQGTIVIGITFGFVESIYRLYVVSNGGAAIKETT